MKPIITLLILTMTLFLTPGCVSKMAISKITQSLSAQQSTVFTGDDDPELIGDALPFTIKFYESLLEKDSLNPELHLATGKLYCLYAQAFIQMPADTLPDSLETIRKTMKKRAKKLLLRGREFALKGLELHHPGITLALKKSPADSALLVTTVSDTSFLYWAAAAWMGAIIADRSDFALAMTIKKAAVLMERVIHLNSSFGTGAAHEVLCAYYANLPKSMGGDDDRSRNHFQKSLDCASGKKASPYVTLAGSISIKQKNRDEFTTLLKKALAISTQERTEYRLQNIIYQQRANWLLTNTDRFFPEDSLSEMKSK
jgi:predicted anti-sigma-YlaC factor YlaD